MEHLVVVDLARPGDVAGLEVLEVVVVAGLVEAEGSLMMALPAA